MERRSFLSMFGALVAAPLAFLKRKEPDPSLIAKGRKLGHPVTQRKWLITMEEGDDQMVQRTKQMAKAWHEYPIEHVLDAEGYYVAGGKV